MRILDLKISMFSPAEDIFPEYRNTPIGKLLEYYNLGSPFDSYPKAQEKPAHT